MKTYYKYSLTLYHEELDENSQVITSKCSGIVCGDGYADAMKEIIIEYGEGISNIEITILTNCRTLELNEDYFSKLEEGMDIYG